MSIDQNTEAMKEVEYNKPLNLEETTALKGLFDEYADADVASQASEPYEIGDVDNIDSGQKSVGGNTSISASSDKSESYETDADETQDEY